MPAHGRMRLPCRRRQGTDSSHRFVYFSNSAVLIVKVTGVEEGLSEQLGIRNI